MFSRMKLGLIAGVVFVLGLLSACGGDSDGGLAQGSSASSGSAQTGSRWHAYTREEQYPATVSLPDEYITMRDGTQIAVHITLPADENGEPVEPVPVVMTITGYNGNLMSNAISNDFLVKRGYAQVFVDERGTGSSTGSWRSFDETAQDDFVEAMDWVAEQPWSNGNVGTWGPSYMGITQLLLASRQHPAHKAAFAIVPMGDAYRDIVFTGGQTNVGFIPLWLGLVNGLGLVPAASLQSDPALTPQVLADHVLSLLLDFSVPTIADAVAGGETAYDSEFWRVRSPLENADLIKVPTFVVGGLNDLFQRGEPMLYEAISDNAMAKLLIGPWTHLDGSFGNGLPADGVPDLDHIALQWFDRYLKGMDNNVQSQPAVTQYLYGEERYVTSRDWPHPQASASQLYLRGDGSLTDEAPQAGEASNPVPQLPINGLCSMSASQWTAGALGALPLPCVTDNRFNEALLEKAYTTEPMVEDMYVNGPIQANVWISTTALDAGVIVRITDVAPDGTSRELTNGLLTASMRAVDAEKSRFLDGQMIQPWHPFTLEAKQPLELGEIVELNVEVFPSSFVIKEGHALRVSIGASDFPHGLPPLPDLLNSLAGVLTIYSDEAHPSNVVLPVVPVSTIPPATE